MNGANAPDGGEDAEGANGAVNPVAVLPNTFRGWFKLAILIVLFAINLFESVKLILIHNKTLVPPQPLYLLQGPNGYCYNWSVV